MQTAAETWEDMVMEVFQETRHPEDMVRHAGLRSHLETVLLEQPELDWEFFLTYEDWMGPVIRTLHEEVVAGERNKLPNRSLHGTLGLFNTRVLIREALDEHSLLQEGTTFITVPFFLERNSAYV